MELSKTTILPTDDIDLAHRLLESLVFEQPYCLMIVLGTSTEAETFVSRASRLSGSQTDPRWVVWVRKPSDIESTIKKLKDSEKRKKLIEKLDNTRGFCLSLSDDVRDVIEEDEPTPDMLRVFSAYVRGEASQ